MESWHALRDEYLRHLRSLGRSTASRETAAVWLNRLIHFSEKKSIAWPAAFTETHFASFREWLCWTPGPSGVLYSQHTVDIALRTARGLFAWAAKRERVLVDPGRNLVLKRVPASEGRILAVEEVKRLLRAPDESTADGLRDRAVLEMLYSTGIRRGECERLNLDDVDIEQRTARIRGKGGHERLAPLGETLTAVLEIYLRDSRPQLAGKDDTLPLDDTAPLFLCKHGTRYLGESIAQMVVRWARVAGVEGVTTHRLRHAFATHLLEGGADFRAVQHLMGHKVPQSTQIYTHVTREEVHRIHRETHPRARRLTSHAVEDYYRKC